jgi:acyl-CoA thioesterase FadM
LAFTQEVRDWHTSLLHCSAVAVVACINLSNKRPRRVPTEVAERLRGLSVASTSNAEV